MPKTTTRNSREIAASDIVKTCCGLKVEANTIPNQFSVMETQLLPGVRKQIALFRRDYPNGDEIANRYLEFVESTEDETKKKPRGIHAATKPKPQSLEELTVEELRKVAGSLKVPKYSYMTKAHLLKVIKGFAVNC